MSKLKVLELFGGIGACSKALERIGIDYEIADYVEIDKYAVKSFNAMHNTNFEPQDICEWDKDIEVDLIMHGSPCQDFSLAGKQAGGDEGSGTRSSLMYETIRIVEKLKPKYVIWENVKNLLSKKHKHNFDAYLETMEELGYTNYYQVLNAKDYGIPQNRERVFTVSILNNCKYNFPEKEELKTTMHDLLEEKAEEKYFLSENMTKYVTEKNIKSKFKVFRPHYASEEKIAHTIQTSGGNRADDNFIIYSFPQKQELKLKLKDMLEDKVDEKYYLSDRMTHFFIYNEQQQKEKGNGFRFNVTDGNVIAKTITTRAGGRMDDNFIGNKELYIKNATKHSVYSEIEKQLFTEDGNIKRYINSDIVDEFKEGQMATTSFPNGYGHGPRTHNESICLNCIDKPSVKQNLRIRKLTPLECWRLMGFDDEDFNKAAKVNSNTQLYKQAGNSIVVNVLEAILTNLLLTCKK